MLFVGEERDLRSIYTQFLVIPCKSIYNFIMGRTFTVVLDFVASLVHLKLKYYNLHEEPTDLHVNLEWD